MRLFHLEEADIYNVIRNPDFEDMEDDTRVACKVLPGRFLGRPLKVIYLIEQEERVIITLYPLGRAERRKKDAGPV